MGLERMSGEMIAVTGALGFIGSRVAASLQRAYPEVEVVAVDHPPVPEKGANGRFLGAARFLDHRAFLEQLAGGAIAPEVIIHMGACSSTTELNWDYLRENNLEYSQELWRWCAREGQRLIYASSAATYGDGSAGFDDEQDIGRLRPLNLYGRSKQEFDLWVRAQARAGAPGPRQCVGFKFFNVFGPGEEHKERMASMVFHAFRQIQSHGQVKLFKSHRPDYADGGQLRDFIYVAQVVDMILQCVQHEEISGLFNLGTGRARSFRDLIEATFQALGRAPQIEYIPMPEDLAGKYQYFTQATMAKAARAGLRLPEWPLEEAVKDYVEYLRAPVPPAGTTQGLASLSRA